MLLKGRQRDIRRRMEVEHAELNVEWSKIRNRPATFADGNRSFYD